MARGKDKSPVLSLEPAQEAAAVASLQKFLDQRFEFELGSFEVQEILELFNREIAPLYYNKAVDDVQSLLRDRFESIESDLWALEKS
ncbi:DUF2164 domain-containing protein [Pseudomonas sp. S9]|uniref:DUF2164 domain-containing protein n=1 Tax=Pseudomonas sp. S9 TaxID=686578 RepID=UPI000255672C|nr:DUF2164 domain-containing protein [Pseudomonas sp. S9]